MIRSRVCRTADFSKPWFRPWSALIGSDPAYARFLGHAPRYHRKLWEWCFICAVLSERGFLTSGKTGLGFAIGTEPLPSIFAKHGVNVIATDLDPQLGESAAWSITNQHAGSLDAIFWPRIVDRATFDRNVRFAHADMRQQWEMSSPVDFIWSSCSLEHLGSLDAGIDFIIRSSRLLEPGGIGVHTTEYNVGSDTGTIETGPSVIYRRRDIEELDRTLRREGKCLARMKFDAGEHEYDRLADPPPYYQTPGIAHVKLWLDGHIATSYGFIVIA